MIFIDDRAGSAELQPLFPNGTPTVISRLDAADFMFYTNGPEGKPWAVGFERKTVQDFLSSEFSGRMGEQLEKLGRDYQLAFIVLEGVWRIGAAGRIEVLLHDEERLGKYEQGQWVEARAGNRGLDHRTFLGFIVTAQVMTGVRFLYTRSKLETVTTVAAAYSWGLKEWEEHRSHLTAHRPASPWKRPTLQWMWAAELPGIGPKRAKAVCKAFGTPEAMVNATVEEWLAVEGVGPTIAKRMVAVMKAKGGKV